MMSLFVFDGRLSPLRRADKKATTRNIFERLVDNFVKYLHDVLVGKRLGIKLNESKKIWCVPLMIAHQRQKKMVEGEERGL